MAASGNKNKIIHVKMVLVGGMGTGKTSLVLRFCEASIFSAAGTYDWFDKWDTAGQERYHCLAPMYDRGAAAAIVVYDMTNVDSFLRTKKWVEELKRQGNPKLVLALVANKYDLETNGEVNHEEGEQFSKENGMFSTEASAKTDLNINELFYEMGA